MDVSVVVAVGRDHYDLLPRQLECLARQQTTRRVEVVVADNAGGLANSRSIQARVVRASDEPGAAYARNRGVEASDGQLLLFCDADDMVCSHWVDAHAVALENAEFTAGPTAVLREGCRADDPEESWAVGRFSERLLRHEGVDIVDSANMGVQREAFERVGGFPEQYLRSQDVGLSLKLRRLGISPQFVPDARVAVSVGVRSLRQEVHVRTRRGRGRVMISRDFGIPQSLSWLVTRGLARTARAFLQPSPRPRHQQIVLEAAELVGIVTQVARPNERR